MSIWFLGKKAFQGANLSEKVRHYEMTTTTPNSQPITPKKVDKQHYDTPSRSRVHKVSIVLAQVQRCVEIVGEM